MRRVWLAVHVAVFAMGTASASEILLPPIAVHPADDFTYLPLDVAVIDDSHVAVVYQRLLEDSPSHVTPEGAFVRVYDRRERIQPFSPPVRLDAPVANLRNLRSNAKVAGKNGRARIAYTIETQVVAPGCSEPCGEDLFLAELTPAGTLGASTQVNTADASILSVDVALLADGTTLVVWGELVIVDQARYLQIFGQLYDADLASLRGKFQISDGVEVVLRPRADGAQDRFAVAYRTDPRQGTDSSTVVTLRKDGSVLRRKVVYDTIQYPDVAVLDDGSVFFTYQRDAGAAGWDNFLTLDDPDGATIGGEYNVSLPRGGRQFGASIAAHQGNLAAATWGSNAWEGMLDFIKINARAEPIDIDPPLLNNRELGSLEIVPNQEVFIAGGVGGALAVLYNAEQYPSLLVGHKTKLMLVRAGLTPCPEGVDCAGLIPLHTTGPAARRLNVVIQPAKYDLGPPYGGERKFLRELRDVLLSNVMFGARLTETSSTSSSSSSTRARACPMCRPVFSATCFWTSFNSSGNTLGSGRWPRSKTEPSTLASRGARILRCSRTAAGSSSTR